MPEFVSAGRLLPRAALGCCAAHTALNARLLLSWRHVQVCHHLKNISLRWTAHRCCSLSFRHSSKVVRYLRVGFTTIIQISMLDNKQTRTGNPAVVGRGRGVVVLQVSWRGRAAVGLVPPNVPLRRSFIVVHSYLLYIFTS